jgi:preprotein translocase subunit YajC
MDNTLFYLAQASAPQGSPLMQFLPFILLMVGFWFLLIQPQRKKQKQHQQMLTELKPGDKVVTAGGICGTITHVKKDRFQVKIDDNTRIDILKGSIQSVDTAE